MGVVGVVISAGSGDPAVLVGQGEGVVANKGAVVQASLSR